MSRDAAAKERRKRATPRAASSKPAEPAPPQVDKSRLALIGRERGETDDEATARMLRRGTVANAMTVIEYSRPMHEDLSLTDLARSLKAQGEAVNRGDLAEAERTLIAQAAALNAIFTELARRAAMHMGAHLDATDRYLRLALKAQAQYRTTIESLHEMKNPRPVAFVAQANIAHGAQQVNNRAAPPAMPASAQAGKAENAQNELSGEGHELLTDAGTSQGPVGANPGLGALEAVYRAANGRG